MIKGVGEFLRDPRAGHFKKSVRKFNCLQTLERIEQIEDVGINTELYLRDVLIDYQARKTTHQDMGNGFLSKYCSIAESLTKNDAFFRQFYDLIKERVTNPLRGPTRQSITSRRGAITFCINQFRQGKAYFQLDDVFRVLDFLEPTKEHGRRGMIVTENSHISIEEILKIAESKIPYLEELKRGLVNLQKKYEEAYRRNKEKFSQQYIARFPLEA